MSAGAADAGAGGAVGSAAAGGPAAGNGGDHDAPLLVGGIKEILLAFLDYLRASLVRKVEGLSEEQARQAPVASGTSLVGLMKHMAFVEGYWVQRRVAGLDIPEVQGTGFEVTSNDTIASTVASYRAACARSDELLAGLDVERPLARGRRGRTVGWVLVHLVEETGRHAGHADILRELIDGATGR
jgi:uncharacterized damage-inducible protein DinB